MSRPVQTGLFLGRYTAEDWLIREHGCSGPEAAEIVALHLRTDGTVKAQDLLAELARGRPAEPAEAREKPA